MLKHVITWIESGWVPDFLVRLGIRKLLRQRLAEEGADDVNASENKYWSFIQSIKSSKIALDTDKANEQHYEVDAAFYQHALGRRKKYSACYYQGDDDLDQAEENMLALYLKRGNFKDGQNILELGCGWGSITLYLAEKLSNANITAVSNSHSQRRHILEQARIRDISNIEVITCDINQLELDEGLFDRIISIEMLEHVRNYEVLFAAMHRWLKPEGLMFIHIFCHRYLMYPFMAEGEDNWMGKYFFSGGQMPAADTFYHAQNHFRPIRRWLVDGTHYQKTSDHWLDNMDQNKEKIMPVFDHVYGDEAKLWFQRWRIFFMSCAELFGYEQGREWMVAHYLFGKSDHLAMKQGDTI